MYKRNIKLLSRFNFFIGFTMFAPLAIIYFAQVSGSFTLGASIFGINALAAAFFEVPTGVLSDRVGRRGTVILGSWARTLAFVFYAIGLSYWWLVAGAILEGLSRSFFSGNNNALLHDTLADEGLESEYSEHLGKTHSKEHLALGISGLVGSLIASVSFSYLMWLSVIPQLIMLYVSYQFSEPRSRTKVQTNIYSHIKEAFKLFLNNKKLRLLSLASIMRFAIGEMKYQFRAAFVNTLWPLWSIGITSIVANFGASASYYYSGKIIKRFNELSVLMFQTISGKVISFISYGFPTVISPILSMLPSFTHGVGSVAENKLMQNEFSDHQRATMSSLNSLGGNIAFFLMSLLLGSLADLLGPARALVIMTAIELPVIYIYWLIFRSESKGRR